MIICVRCDGKRGKRCSADNCSGGLIGHCIICKGTGIDRHTDVKCYSCKGTGFEECPFCKGKGFEECFLCNGTGVLLP